MAVSHSARMVALLIHNSREGQIAHPLAPPNEAVTFQNARVPQDLYLLVDFECDDRRLVTRNRSDVCTHLSCSPGHGCRPCRRSLCLAKLLW